MLEGFSYSPGENVYYDLIFTLFLIVISIISYWSMFYGLRFILTPDRKRVFNNEKYLFKLILKFIVLLYPIAMFIGFPLFVNVLCSSLIFLQPLFVILDSTTTFNLYVWILFIIAYASYLYFFFKRINKKMDQSLEKAVDFYSDWDFLTLYRPDSIDPGLYNSRRQSTVWTIGIYKFVIHFSLVPLTIITILNLLFEIF